MLIRLTDQPTGRPLLLNPAAIVSVVPLPGEVEGTRLPERTRIAAGNGEIVVVRETPEQVEALTRRRPDDGLLAACKMALERLAELLKQAEAERDGLVGVLTERCLFGGSGECWWHSWSSKVFATRAAAVADLLERARGGRA